MLQVLKVRYYNKSCSWDYNWKYLCEYIGWGDRWIEMIDG